MLTIKRKSGARLTLDRRGAELKSWITEDGIERLWQGDPVYWEETAPWLFPFVGRLHEKRYTFEDKSYPMDIHGIIRDMNFTVLEQQEESILLELTSSPESREVYPFDFYLRVRYTLSNHGYTSEFSIFHSSESPQTEMIFGLGGHPGFNLDYPLETYKLELPQVDKAELRHAVFSENGLLTDLAEIPEDIWTQAEIPTLDLGRWDFDAQDLFLINPGDRTNLICSECQTELSMETDGYDTLGLWRASGAPYLCLEPWASLPGREGIVEDLETKPHMLRLPRGEKKVFRYRVHIA